MPNGGFPAHALLRPLGGPGDWVIHCETTEISVYTQDEWDSGSEVRTPMLTLSHDETEALTRFLMYWIGDEAHGQILRGRRDKVNIEFHF